MMTITGWVVPVAELLYFRVDSGAAEAALERRSRGRRTPPRRTIEGFMIPSLWILIGSMRARVPGTLRFGADIVRLMYTC